MQALESLVRDTGILLLGDEVYEHIIFDGRTHQSLLRHDQLAGRSLVVSSFGKSVHATGWKIGYCVAPAELTAEFRKVHQFVQFCVAAPMQYALADFLHGHPEHLASLADFYAAKRDRFCALLAPSRFTFRPSAGTYFQLADYSAISTEPDTEFVRSLTLNHTRSARSRSPVQSFRPTGPVAQAAAAEAGAVQIAIACAGARPARLRR